MRRSFTETVMMYACIFVIAVVGICLLCEQFDLISR